MSAKTTDAGSPATRPARHYRFGSSEIDAARHELLFDGQLVEVQPLVLDLLVFLIERRDRTVDKDELLDALWRGTVVTEASLTQAIRKARAVVGDDGDRQQVIRTVSRRGYRFVAPLEVIEDEPVPQATTESSEAATHPPWSLVGELKRRHVLRVALLYLAVSWLLLQVADILLPTFVVPDWGMRLVVALLALGFPAALVFAWVFDLTPEGLRRDRGGLTPGSEKTGRRFAVGTLFAIVLAAGLFVLGRLSSPGGPAVPASPPPGPARSVAVLPFTNDGAEPGNVYFSDGIAEELLNLLAGIPELRVAARTSSFRFRDPALDVREIGPQLDVRHVVEGMVRRDGDRVRISAQLVDTATGYHLWSQVYETRLEDVFRVQSEIARRIAQQLELVLTPEIARTLNADSPTANAELHDDYLLARHLFLERGSDRVERSIELLERIVTRDPGYGRAWATLSAAYTVRASYRGSDYAKYNQLARHAAGKALALDPRLAEAHAALAFMHADEYDWARTFEAFDRAIALEPGDVTTRLWYGVTLAAVGWLDAALVQLEIAAARDPLSAFVHSWLASLYYWTGRLAEAEAAAQRARDLGMTVYATFYVALAEGDDERAIREWEAFWREENVDPAFVRPLVEALRDRSRIEAALEAVQATADRADASQPADSIVHRLAAYLLLGAADPAYRELRQVLASLPRRRTVALTMLWGPDGATLRGDSRFIGLTSELGLVNLWRQRGWPGFCQETAERIECH